MVLTESSMLEIGSTAHPFSLVDVKTGNTTSLNDLKSETATVIMFICNHCPFVIHLQKALVDTANKYQPQGINFIAISSNDADTYPEDSPDNMKSIVEEFNYPFPYLYDETQEVAKAYKATCTPDFFIFDENLKCVYRGRYDDSSPGKKNPITGKDIHDALDNILTGNPVDREQKPSMGCSIKWKAKA